MEPSSSGFDPTQFTQAPLQTDAWMRFTDPPEQVFKRMADHEGMKEWFPLLKNVTVTQPHSLPPGESTIGTTRTMEFQGGVTLVEQVVFWNPPYGYAYTTTGKVFPLQHYIGFIGVEPAEGDGGTLIFREYYDVQGKIQNAVIPHGVAVAMKQVLGKLSKLIGGTDYDATHVTTEE